MNFAKKKKKISRKNFSVNILICLSVWYVLVGNVNRKPSPPPKKKKNSLTLIWKSQDKNSLSYSDEYLESSQTFTMEFFSENSLQLKAVNYFPKKDPSYIFDWVLNTPLVLTIEWHTL